VILSRLREWLPEWQSGPDAATRGAAGLAMAPRPLARPVPDAGWPSDRLAVSDALWGTGYMVPGGEAEVLRLAKPLGLSEASSVLLLGCGTGGAARCLAEEFGAWVSGFEADAALVAAASRLCTGAGLAKQAAIESWDPAAPRFAARYYHHALALEPLRRGRVETLLPALAGALRPGGNLVLTDVVDADAAAGASALAAWLRAEDRAMPPPASAVARALAGLGFDIRVAEDITHRHVGLMARGWRDLVRGIGAARPTPAKAAHLVAEAEMWLQRARVMRGGRVRLMRWHAIGREASVVC